MLGGAGAQTAGFVVTVQVTELARSCWAIYNLSVAIGNAETGQRDWQEVGALLPILLSSASAVGRGLRQCCACSLTTRPSSENRNGRFQISQLFVWLKLTLSSKGERTSGLRKDDVIEQQLFNCDRTGHY